MLADRTVSTIPNHDLTPVNQVRRQNLLGMTDLFLIRHERAIRRLIDTKRALLFNSALVTMYADSISALSCSTHSVAILDYLQHFI